MRLYELTEQFLALQELAYDPEVDEQTFQDTMEGLWGEIEDKADGYAKIIMGMTGILQLNKPIMRYRPDKACFFNVKFFVLYYSILWYFL